VGGERPANSKGISFSRVCTDEIDISIKNEYVPFILPRLTRLMKLRKYHKKMDWNVPIECDAEYGHSWDVDYNVTDKNFQRLTPISRAGSLMYPQILI